MTWRVPKAHRAVLAYTAAATLLLAVVTAVNWLCFGEFWLP